MIQVVLNILGNAKEVFLAREKKDGVISVTATKVDKQIRIIICDNAGGIKDSIMEKISEPYITTKEVFNGVGLGLYISRTILEKYKRRRLFYDCD